MPGYLANLESLGLISRLPVSRMTAVSQDFLHHPPPKINVTEVMAEQLCQRLQWQ